jgi:hypothetical protein
MNIRAWGSRFAIACALLLAGTIGGAAILPHDSNKHRSSLHATVTMTDGTTRRVVVQGVGCPEAMCSRVRAKDSNDETVWLDQLVSVQDISRNTSGAVRAALKFRNGTERGVSIVALNRVLYVRGGWWTAKKLDLARVTKINFE